ncbi:MAG TPA: hypothetical protein VGZ27_14790 [Vicinamibacterales bacterium]|jgi:hypothetical protein|nr:hypothetical protein [Vicinamibacterales bacterium]
MIRLSSIRRVTVPGLLVLGLFAVASAQSSKSLTVAKELTAALDAQKLDAIAARMPSDPDRYVAALYYPGVQLLVISGKYPAPQLMDPRIAQKQYRDVYMELSGTVAKESKIFVLDMGAPGLTQKKTDGYFDTWTQGDKQILFDGNWDAQKMSEADYNKAYAAADEEYAKMLGALLEQVKK